MDITQELVERIAHLSGLTLSEGERARMTTQLEGVLSSVTKLDALVLEEEDAEREWRGEKR